MSKPLDGTDQTDSHKIFTVKLQRNQTLQGNPLGQRIQQYIGFLHNTIFIHKGNSITCNDIKDNLLPITGI